MRLVKFIFLGIFVLYFQLLAAPHMAIFSIIPNFFISYLAYISIKNKAKSLFPIAFILGLALDIMYPPLLGLNTISFLIIVFLINRFHSNVNKQKFIIVSLSILFLNFIYYSIFFLYHVLASQIIEHFFLLFLFSILYNSIISILSVYLLIITEKIKITLHV
jgi:rod shape-determining protein MreD